MKRANVRCLVRSHGGHGLTRKVRRSIQKAQHSMTLFDISGLSGYFVTASIHTSFQDGLLRHPSLIDQVWTSVDGGYLNSASPTQ